MTAPAIVKDATAAATDGDVMNDISSLRVSVEDGHTVGRTPQGKIRLVSSKALAVTGNLSAAYQPNARDEWIERARAVKVDTVIGRHAITLKREGAEHVGPCPHCGGKDRFSINPAKNVWNCRGCNKGGGDGISLEQFISGTDFLGAVEYLVGKPPESTAEPNSGQAQLKLVATYPYRDEHGELLYEVCRFEPKTFRPRRSDGNGGYIYERGTRRVPYRLPELIASIEADRTMPIVIVEGEKDVDNLAELGCTASCNDGGAEKWPPELAQYFRGAEVVLIADNDEPGRRHVAKVGAALKGTAARVRVLSLAEHWPECPDKGDISDWLVAGHGADDLGDLIGKARDYMGDATKGADGTRSEDPQKPAAHSWHHNRIDLYMLKQEQIDERGHTVPDIISEGNIILLVGRPKIGKSWVALDIGGAVQNGGSALGLPARRRAHDHDRRLQPRSPERAAR
jgi:CHC2 zinc finger